MITIEFIDTPPGTPRARRVRFEEINETVIIPAPILKELNIEVGDSFPDTSDLETLISECSQQAASARVMKLVSMRDYSTAELKKKLSEDGYSRDVIDSTIAYAIRIGAADDERYLHAFVRSCVSAGQGEHKILRTLQKKGFDKKDIDIVYSEYIDEDALAFQLEKAMRVIQYSDLSDYNNRDKAFRKIVTRGYSFDTAKTAIQRVLDQKDEKNSTAAEEGSSGPVTESFYQPSSEEIYE